ncbi:MAG: YkgJ family cysteine cluster protein [Deltaproteobacteria bacterium]|nr:MAG: YkgJ family cysteine cluster protein [Deltaproteobacteria bacterium]
MEHNMTPLSLDDSFQFSCTKHVTCFNSCCRDLNQFLTPFDILQLKNHLDITSGKFLAHYTTQHIGPSSGLPITTLKPTKPSGLTCPFVTPSGCSVYKARPSSCRMYPIVRVIIRSRVTGKVRGHFQLLKEPHCRGFYQDKVQTVGEWIEAQGLAIYNKINDMLMEIISLKNLHIPGPLDIRLRHMFQMALYDLDTFRSNILNKGLLDDLHLDAARLAAIKNDDIELLKLGHLWIKQTIIYSELRRENAGSSHSYGWRLDSPNEKLHPLKP